MRHPSKYILAGLFFASHAFAIEPASGWYVSGFGGASYTPSIDFSISLLSSTPLPSSLSYDILANGGLEAGYRCDHFRFAGEVMYNQNPYDNLVINGLSIPGNTNSLTTFGFEGYTGILAGFFNVYYDFFSEESESNFVPYVGLGIGYANVRNQLQFYYNQLLLGENTESINGGIGQVIVGLNYFFNEQWAFGTDFRLMSTETLDFTHHTNFTSNIVTPNPFLTPVSQLNFNHHAAAASWNLALTYTFDE